MVGSRTGRIGTASRRTPARRKELAVTAIWFCN